MIYLHTLQLVANGYILMFTGFGIGISHRDATIDLGGNLFWTGFMIGMARRSDSGRRYRDDSARRDHCTVERARLREGIDKHRAGRAATVIRRAAASYSYLSWRMSELEAQVAWPASSTNGQ